MSKNDELEIIEQKLNSIKDSGFGEIRVVVRNGTVYRILSTEDELLEHKTSK
jgi:hypothetical protein